MTLFKILRRHLRYSIRTNVPSVWLRQEVVHEMAEDGMMQKY